jgi:chromosome segregation ATPase
MSDLSLLWNILSIVVPPFLSVLGSVAFAAWWFKGQLTSAQLAGLKEQNAALREQKEAHTSWRGLAEAQAKQLAEQLAEARATIATLQRQIAEGAKKEVLANTAASSSRAIEHAESLLDMMSWDVVRTPIIRETVRSPPAEFGAWPSEERAPELTKKSND